MPRGPKGNGQTRRVSSTTHRAPGRFIGRLENGLKAALEHRAVDRSLKWFHSHDLQMLRDLTRKEGLFLLPNADALIDELSIHHKEHHFRYPQKARRSELTKPSTAVILTDAILRMVFDFIDGHARVDE
jgi:hypothetical protein